MGGETTRGPSVVQRKNPTESRQTGCVEVCARRFQKSNLSRSDGPQRV